MTGGASVSEVLARLEAAECGSRELDREVWGGLFGARRMPKPGLFTTSPDAALALAERVLPGSRWECGVNSYEGAWAVVYADLVGSGGRAPTPARALCIAILRARQAEGVS